MTRRPTITVAVMLTMALGACSRSDEPAPAANDVGATVEVTPPTAVAPEPPVAASTPAVTADANMTIEAPPEVPPAPDEQMMDDASATGMTARSSRGEPAPDETAPVEQVEKK